MLVQSFVLTLDRIQFLSVELAFPTYSYSVRVLEKKVRITRIGLVFVLQQGNRSSSSACGSADVLEALGVVIDLEPEVSSS